MPFNHHRQVSSLGATQTQGQEHLDVASVVLRNRSLVAAPDALLGVVDGPFDDGLESIGLHRPIWLREPLPWSLADDVLDVDAEINASVEDQAGWIVEIVRQVR